MHRIKRKEHNKTGTSIQLVRKRGFYMRTVDGDIIAYTKKRHPTGTFVELIQMKHHLSPPVGSKGLVIHVDDMGTIHTRWDNGVELGLIPGEDRWRIVRRK